MRGPGTVDEIRNPAGRTLGGSEYMIRRTDTGDFWDGGNPYFPGREHWTDEAHGTRYDGMSIATMESFRFDIMPFEVEVVQVARQG